ncbi:MAG TPA: hypothetical protein VMU42_15260 [Candidatus Sulfotelmatobacter sp.]|nr:hypothetical protein [Candidatus Sulfotelmatobacter sp.]
MDQFRIDASDEYPHRPDASSNFNESVYTNAFDPRLGLGGWMRLGNRVNEGHAELSVCLYLPGGRVACQFQRPAIRANDRFEAGGLKVEVVEPLKAITMTYDGELMLLDDPGQLRDPQAAFKSAPRVRGQVEWRHRAVSPIHGGEPISDAVPTMYGRDFSLGHFNQHTDIAGSIRVGDEHWPLAAHGWRDHSWGPRYWQSIYFYRLFMANFGGGRGLMLLKISDREGRARRQGVLLVDGQYEEIVDMDLLTGWSPEQDPATVRIGVRTARRAEVIEGEVVTMAPLRNRRKAGDATLVSRIAEGFTRFTWNGAVGYGMTEYIERVEDGRLLGYPL